MMKNPLVWATIFALLFLVWKKDEIIDSKKPSLPSQDTSVKEIKTTSAPQAEISPHGSASIATQKLPLKMDLSLLTEQEVHHMREWNNQTGKIIGELVQNAQQTPPLREATLRLFLQCAEDAKITQSARALCWRKLTNKINEWKVFVSIADAKVPLKIQRLALRLNLDHREF